MRLDSKTKIFLMSRGDAPTAFMTPISEVLSRTAMTMVLMIPREATKMAIMAIAARNMSISTKPVLICSNWSTRANVE